VPNIIINNSDNNNSVFAPPPPRWGRGVLKSLSRPNALPPVRFAGRHLAIPVTCGVGLQQQQGNVGSTIRRAKSWASSLVHCDFPILPDLSSLPVPLLPVVLKDTEYMPRVSSAYELECSSSCGNDLEDLDVRGVSFPSPDEIVLENEDFSIRIGLRSVLSFHSVLASTESSLTDTLATDPASFCMAHQFTTKKPFHCFTFSEGAVSILTTPNAGGASENSEALSFEVRLGWVRTRVMSELSRLILPTPLDLQVLHRLFGAILLKTEMQIHYSPNSKKTDYLCIVRNQRLGVSVTRAMKHTDPNDFSSEDAEVLLLKKLNGVRESTTGVMPQDAWTRQVCGSFSSVSIVL